MEGMGVGVREGEREGVGVCVGESEEEAWGGAGGGGVPLPVAPSSGLVPTLPLGHPQVPNAVATRPIIPQAYQGH